MIAASLLVATPAIADPPLGGHYHGPNGWAPHEPWHRDFRRFDPHRWRGGHWWHGAYGGRLG